MISIVTAYYNRKKLFVQTLKSIQRQNFSSAYEVIAVDDGSDEAERLEDLVEEFPFLRVIRLDPSKKWYKNSCIPFNVGFKAAKGEKIIIQNPECFHLDNILQFSHENLTKNKFLSFSCFSLDKEQTEKLANSDYNRISLDSIISISNHRFKMDGELGWYNHSIYHPVFYHFCIAISKKDLFDLGGFDERFAMGIGYDDDEFVFRIKEKKMDMSIIDNFIVLHQNHYNHTVNSAEILAQKQVDYKRNADLFENVTKSNKSWRVNYLGDKENLGIEEEVQDNYSKYMCQSVNEIAQYKVSRRLAFVILYLLKRIKF